MKRSLIAPLIVGVLIAGGCLGVVVSRALWEGRGALATAAQAADRGQLADAITWYRRAARWYVPLAGHVPRAYDELEGIASAAEAAGESDLALAAWQGIRSSIYATRSFYIPQSHRLPAANRRIAALMAAQETESVQGGATADRQAWHYSLLARDDAPSVPWSVLALFGFALWIGGGVHFALHAVTGDDQLVGKTAARAGGFVAIGLVMWMLGLYNA
jgi:hypothetical protein